MLIEMFEERPEIKKLRDEFIAGLPKVTQSLLRFPNLREVKYILLYLTLIKKIKNSIPLNSRPPGPTSRNQNSPTTPSPSAS